MNKITFTLVFENIYLFKKVLSFEKVTGCNASTIFIEILSINNVPTNYSIIML